jgi:hypothetical protein
MSLLRLLTAGKSLIGQKNPEGRYQLPGARSLPHFGSKKNPFRATVFPDKAEGINPEPGSGDSMAQTKTSGEIVSLVGESGESEAVSAPSLPESDSCSPTAPVPVTATPGLDEPSPRRTGLKALLLWGRARKHKPSGAGRPMVQGELSLDSVKVMRNDLAETDLEVVPARPAPKAAPEPKAEKPGTLYTETETPRSRGMVGRLLSASKM